MKSSDFVRKLSALLDREKALQKYSTVALLDQFDRDCDVLLGVAVTPAAPQNAELKSGGEIHAGA